MENKLIFGMRWIVMLNALCFFSSHVSAQNTDRPNVVLILIDDSGLMDLGAFGGEASTPTIDSLARNGIMYTNMHASPVCAPSRAMLMTGSTSHEAGVANLPEFLPKKYQSFEGYEGVLNDSVQTIATRLKELDYNTYVAGKWHLGHDERTLPTKRGFDRSFILAGSGGDNFVSSGYLPFKAEVKWFADGQLTELPDDFYSSKHFVDQLIRFHEEEESNEPFFTYLPFMAVHAPIQAPTAYVEKYIEVYKEGWDVLRQKRFEKAKELGIIPQNAEMNPYFEEFEKWSDLPEKKQEEYIIDIATMAGMLEAMDYHIGRYIEFLKKKGLANNTVFIVTSDNGPEAGDYSSVKRWARRRGYHRDFEEKGGYRYYGFIGPVYASAIAAPFSYFKYYTGEGGLRVPFIVSGLDFSRPEPDNSFCFITDIAPTIYDLVGLSTSANQGFVPISGKSMLSNMKNGSPVYHEDEGVGLEAAGCSAYFMGGFKLVRNIGAFGDEQWRLYNLDSDPTESKDIASENPLVFQTLLSKYELYARKVGVLSMPKGYSAEKEVAKKSMRTVLNPFKK